jgi:lysyl-tRNA synthetase class II
MKTQVCTLLLAGSFALLSCNDKKEAYDSTPPNSKDSIEVSDSDAHAHDGEGHDDHDHGHSHDAAVEVDAPVDVTVNGTVGEITFGKDGYTAQLKDDSGREYFVTISRANLDDPKQYRELKAGDKITVKGESFKLDNKLHIKVEDLK